MNNPQLNKNGELQHLLTTEGLPAPILRDILDRASCIRECRRREGNQENTAAAWQGGVQHLLRK